MVEFAKSELDRLVKFDDETQKEINNDILEIIKVFESQGHSGFSAGYALGILKRLLCWKPISELEDIDEDWSECTWHKDDNTVVYQNKRCSSVFKEVNKETGKVTYTDNDKCIISDNGGITWFGSNGFDNTVEFPYYPPDEPEKIYIEYLDEDEDKYDIITEDKERIKSLHDKKRAEYDSVEWE